MTNEVKDSNLMLLCFLIIRYRESDNILSHEAIDPYLKKVTFSIC